MAAVYTTGTVGPSATSATDLRTAVDAAILSHPNWSLVEAITITGGTSRVYKCSGSGANANSWAQDFYVALTQRTASPSALDVQVFEAYTPAPTSQAVRSCRGSGSTTVAAPNANGGYVVDNTAYTLDNTTTTQLGRQTITLDSTNGWAYMVQASRSRLHFSIGRSTNTQVAIVAGVYVPNPRTVAAASGMFPLVNYALSANNSVAMGGVVAPSNTAMYSRNPGSGTVGNAGISAASSNTAAGAISTGGQVVDALEGAVRPSGVSLLGYAATGPSFANVTGILRGSLPGLYAFYNSASLPSSTDLVVLSDGTRLASLAGNNVGLHVDVDSDY